MKMGGQLAKYIDQSGILTACFSFCICSTQDTEALQLYQFHCLHIYSMCYHKYSFTVEKAENRIRIRAQTLCENSKMVKYLASLGKCRHHLIKYLIRMSKENVITFLYPKSLKKAGINLKYNEPWYKQNHEWSYLMNNIFGVGLGGLGLAYDLVLDLAHGAFLPKRPQMRIAPLGLGH